jgi:hypothetical protein
MPISNVADGSDDERPSKRRRLDLDHDSDAGEESDDDKDGSDGGGKSDGINESDDEFEVFDDIPLSWMIPTHPLSLWRQLSDEKSLPVQQAYQAQIADDDDDNDDRTIHPGRLTTYRIDREAAEQDDVDEPGHWVVGIEALDMSGMCHVDLQDRMVQARKTYNQVLALLDKNRVRKALYHAIVGPHTASAKPDEPYGDPAQCALPPELIDIVVGFIVSLREQLFGMLLAKPHVLETLNLIAISS